MSEEAAAGPHFRVEKPAGDDRDRHVCGHCGFIDYRNPKIVVGSVLTYDGRVLLCRRAIEPRKGFWTLPAGYLELGESVEAGARREAFEEACVEARLERVLGVYSVPRISQVQIFFRGTLAGPQCAPGSESLETRLFAWGDIPWPEIAFPTAEKALRHWKEVEGRVDFAPFGFVAD